MDGCGHEFQLNVVCSRWSSAAGYLTVLKNNFAGTQAPEMGEQSPLTYFCRSRGTHDVNSVRSRRRRLGWTTEVARELQFHVNNLMLLVAVLPTSREWNVGICKRASVQLAATPTRCPCSHRAERQLKRRRVKATTVAVGCASMAARAARPRMTRTRELHLA